MKYCRLCVLPDTRPQLVLDAEGVCNACRNHRSKDAINWTGREQAFRQVAETARARAGGWDCLIPVSGGKDSTWQVVTCLEYGLRPLAVTYAPPARTEIGRRNLDNLIRLGVDHVDWHINPEVEKRFILAALEKYGSTAIPMHMALFNIPLRLALKLDIPLVVWGENSGFEYGSKDDEAQGFQLDSTWLKRFGVTHGTSANDWVGTGLSAKDLASYFGPAPEELERQGIRAVFLGYYFPWDPVKTYDVARRHGFRAAAEGARTGYYNFADIDDDFISIHHHLKWYKFGFTRLFDNLSIEIRNGRLTRDQALALIRARGEETPERDIASLCAFLGITRERFAAIAEGFRNKAIWSHEGGVWKIPGFLIPDFSWP